MYYNTDAFASTQSCKFQVSLLKLSPLQLHLRCSVYYIYYSTKLDFDPFKQPIAPPVWAARERGKTAVLAFENCEVIELIVFRFQSNPKWVATSGPSVKCILSACHGGCKVSVSNELSFTVKNSKEIELSLLVCRARIEFQHQSTRSSQ